MLFKFENVVAKQHPHVCTHHYTCTWTIIACNDVVPLLHDLPNENYVITCLWQSAASLALFPGLAHSLLAVQNTASGKCERPWEWGDYIYLSYTKLGLKLFQFYVQPQLIFYVCWTAVSWLHTGRFICIRYLIWVLETSKWSMRGVLLMNSEKMNRTQFCAPLTSHEVQRGMVWSKTEEASSHNNVYFASNHSISSGDRKHPV